MTPDHIHRAVVLYKTALKASELDRLIAERRFPPPSREHGEFWWLRSEVEAWLQQGSAVTWLRRAR